MSDGGYDDGNDYEDHLDYDVGEYREDEEHCRDDEDYDGDENEKDEHSRLYGHCDDDEPEEDHEVLPGLWE